MVPQPAEPDAPPSSPELRRSFVRYLAVMVGILALFIALFVIWGVRGRDHFAQIRLEGDRAWYQNYAHLETREMQDRDVLFHGIGRSIANARRADIILLGHSVLEFAIVDAQVREFERRHGVRIFNLTNPGIASGEYIRRLIRKQKLHPKIWVINADDYPANFFNPKMDDFFASGRNSAFRVVDGSKLSAYLMVAARAIRWRVEGLLAEHGPDFVRAPPFSLLRNAPTTWRSVETGDFHLDRTLGFLSRNPPMKIIRDGSCSITDQEVDWAHDYLAGIGGTPILTLVPYERWCPNRVRELADDLGVESILPETTPYSTFDGTHMDQAGATAYTAFLLSSLENSRAFRMMKGQPDPGLPVSRTRHREPIGLCIRNTTSARMFVSLRARGSASDHVVGPGEELRQMGVRGGQICSDENPFSRNQCPHLRSQGEAICGG